MRGRLPIAIGIATAVIAAALVLPAAMGDDGEPWIIEAGPEMEGAVKAGAATVKKAQKLAKKKKYVEAVELLEGVARQWPAAVHDCNLSLAYLRAGALTRAQLLWDVAGLRNAERPSWCVGDLAAQLSTALRAAGFVPLTISVVPPDAIVEVGGVTIRGIHVVWLPAGTHLVVARAEGFVDGATELALDEGNASVTLELSPPVPPDAAVPDAGPIDAPSPDAAVIVPVAPVDAAPPLPPKTIRRAPTRWPGYAGLAAGAVLVGVGAVFHVRAVDARDDGNAVYVNTPEFDDASDRFSKNRVGAVISYAIGAAAVGFGTWWLLRADVEVSEDAALVTFGGDW